MNNNKDFVSHEVHLPNDPSISVLNQNVKYKKSLRKQKKQKNKKPNFKIILWFLGLIVLNILFQLIGYYNYSDFKFNCGSCLLVSIAYCIFSLIISAYSDIAKNPEKYETINKAKAEARQKQIEELKKQSEQDKQSNKPQCPTCHSYNVRPISGLNRAGSVFAWGLFSSKIGKTYECLNCKYKW